MTFEINLNDEDTATLQRYMKDMNMTVSEVARQAILEMIFEDDDALAAYNEAMEEYRKDPVAYPVEEVWKRLGL